MQLIVEGGTVRFIGAGSFLAVLLYWNSASSQSRQWITVGSEVAPYQQELCDPQMKMEPPNTSDVEILVELVGLPNVSKINALRLHIRRRLGLKNACALPEAGGFATIAYDPDWAAGDTPAFYLTLGHEAGHHFCGHFVGDAHGSWAQSELEADQFGGASIKRFEVYHNRSLLSQVLAAAAAKYPEQGSSSHPARALRLEAIKRGYEQGSQCGDLAPVEQSGFSPGVRANGPPTPCRPVRTGPTSYACEH
jgi:hypothetical protein